MSVHRVVQRQRCQCPWNQSYVQLRTAKWVAGTKPRPSEKQYLCSPSLFLSQTSNKCCFPNKSHNQYGGRLPTSRQFFNVSNSNKDINSKVLLKNTICLKYNSSLRELFFGNHNFCIVSPIPLTEILIKNSPQDALEETRCWRKFPRSNQSGNTAVRISKPAENLSQMFVQTVTKQSSPNLFDYGLFFSFSPESASL